MDEPDAALLPGLGNQVGGPGDYLPTERLAVDFLVEAQFLGL